MKSKRRHKDKKISTQDLSYCNEFSIIDMNKTCPTFMKAVELNEVHLSTLQELQNETETVLASLAERATYLLAEISETPIPKHLQRYLQAKQLIVKSNPEKPLTLIISQKRALWSADEDSRPWKRLKVDTSNNNNTEDKHEPYANGGCSMSPTSFIDPNHNKKMYEIPNKFWALMEPYCADITEENVKTLEIMLKRYDEDDEVYKIPPLGLSANNSRHSTVVKQEPHDTAVSRKWRRSQPKSLKQRIDLSLRQSLPCASPVAALADSLSCHLFQENVTAPLQRRKAALDRYITDTTTLPSKLLAKQLRVSNSYKLEKRIRQNMKELPEEEARRWSQPGVTSGFDLEDGRDEEDQDGEEGLDFEEEGGDQVVRRLTKSQRELAQVAEGNRNILKRLLSASRSDLNKQEIGRRLAVADADVIEAFKKLDQYRHNRKVPLKRDRDTAWKVIKERKKVLKEQESLDSKIVI